MENKIINYGKNFDLSRKSKFQSLKNNNNDNFYSNNARLLYSIGKLDSIEISQKNKS